jgi:hypothetical protein
MGAFDSTHTALSPTLDAEYAEQVEPADDSFADDLQGTFTLLTFLT